MNKKVILFLLTYVLTGCSSFMPQEAKADVIHHETEEVATDGLNVNETASNATMTFTNLSLDTVTANSYFAITLNAINNHSPSLADPYIYLQFSFNNGDTQKVLEFDQTDPQIQSRLVKNSLYYPTSENGYEVPNRFFTDSSSYWFLIKEGFSGTIYVPMFDYFKDNLNIDSFTIFSDGSNHFNLYHLFDISLCDDIYGTNKRSIYNISSLHYKDDFVIDDSDLSYDKQSVKINTYSIDKIIGVHINQSRLTMLNIINTKNDGNETNLTISLDKNYSVRDEIIMNMNNLSSSPLSFKLSLVKDDNTKVSVSTDVSQKYTLCRSDTEKGEVICDGNYVILPSQTINSTMVFRINNFNGEVNTIKGLELVFLNNNLNLEIGKIIDSQDTITGNFKTLFNPTKYNQEELSIDNPTSGTKVRTSNTDVAFKWNEQDIYHIEMSYKALEGTVTYLIDGDYAIFSVQPKPGYIVDKAYINEKQVNVVDNKITICLVEDLNLDVTFKEAKIYTNIDNTQNGIIVFSSSYDEVEFKVVLASGYVIDSAFFNDKKVTFSQDNTLSVSKSNEAFNLVVTTRKANVSISYVDEPQNRHGNVETSIKNGKLYLIFKPEENYQLDYLIINDVKTSFNGAIYSTSLNKDVFAEVKFIKKH